MAIKIPALGPSSSGPGPAGVDSRTAMAPGLSLSSVARGLGAASDALEEHDERVKEVINSADLTEIRTRMKSAYAEYSAGLAENHDPKSYLSGWEDRLQGLEQELFQGDYAPVVVDRAREAFESFKGDTKIGVAAAAQNKALARQKQAFANGMDMALQGYNPSMPSDGDFEELMADHPGTPEEKEAMRRMWEQATDQKRTAASIYDDPQGWLDENREPSGNVSEWEANRRRARQVLGERKREQADEVLNGIFTDQIHHPGTIEVLTPDLTPVERAELEEALKNRDSAEMESMRQSPEYQEQVAGEISAMISAYKPGGGEFDPDYVKIQERIEHLESGPLKAEYKRQAAAIREGREREIESVRDWAGVQVEEYFDSGDEMGAPEKPAGRSLGSYLDGGFLSDENRLKSFGWSEEQSREIVKASKEKLESERKGVPYKGPDPEDLVRQYWDQGNAAAADFPKEEWAVFQAIRDNKTASARVYHPDEAERYQSRLMDYQTERNRARGRAMRELAEFFKFNPQADMEKAGQFLEELNIDIEAGETNSDWEPFPIFKDSPLGGAGAGETGELPDKPFE